MNPAYRNEATRNRLQQFFADDADTDTTRHHDNARHYDPNTGRWSNQEPIGRFDAGDDNFFPYPHPDR